MRVETLPQGAAGLVFVTPSHQFPLGYTLPLERRVTLLAQASALGAYVFEDDYDSDFRHEGSPLTASMFRDVKAGAKVEADHIIGDLIARADAAKVPVPKLKIAYTNLKTYENQRG